MTDKRVDPARLFSFRPYLQMLVRMTWDSRLQAKLDPSDVVQETLLKAQRSIDQHRGATDAELAAWLRKILANELAQTRRAFHQAKRDVGRENAYDVTLEQSSLRLCGPPVGGEPSPSHQAEFNERALRLAQAVESLPEAQRDAIVLHYFQDLTLPEVAERCGKSTTAVAGLIHRGLKKLRSTVNHSI
jgi:RNA polymerase sigma-70 factor (ECF subfamily)